MADIDLQLAREFFELNRFQVTTHWHQHDRVARGPDGDMQLFVKNPSPGPEEALDVVLHSTDLVHLRLALVEVRAWHTDRFYSSLIDSNPIVTQFAESWALGPARDFFGTDEFKTILVISELPRSADQRADTIKRLQRTGVDHVLEFPTILKDLAAKVAMTGSYAGSPSLQLLQLLKRYRLLRNQQLEFFFPSEPQVLPRPSIDTAVPNVDDGDES